MPSLWIFLEVNDKDGNDHGTSSDECQFSGSRHIGEKGAEFRVYTPRW